MTKFHDDLESLDRLREILLSSDREKIRCLEEENQRLEEEVRHLKEIIEQEEELSKRVAPIMSKEVVRMKDGFSGTFGEEVKVEFEKNLRLSENLLIQVIGPIMGKMIKKYLNKEMQKLKDQIDHQVKTTFSFKRHYHTIRARVFGVKASEIWLAELDDYKAAIQDVLVIQRSGIPKGHYTKNPSEESGDKDIFSGMLTAIKAFGEDGFRESGKGQQHLEFIDYETFKIFLQNHEDYYFTVILRGVITSKDKHKLSEKLYDIAEKEKDLLNEQNITGETRQRISDMLKKYFD